MQFMITKCVSQIVIFFQLSERVLQTLVEENDEDPQVSKRCCI